MIDGLVTVLLLPPTQPPMNRLAANKVPTKNCHNGFGRKRCDRIMKVLWKIKGLLREVKRRKATA